MHVPVCSSEKFNSEAAAEKKKNNESTCSNHGDNGSKLISGLMDATRNMLDSSTCCVNIFGFKWIVI